MLFKIREKIIHENAFEQKKKETRVKFNPGLSANWPSNNWAQETYLFVSNLWLCHLHVISLLTLSSIAIEGE